MRAKLPLISAAFALGLIAGDAWPACAEALRALALLGCAGAGLALLLRRGRECTALACAAAFAAGGALMGARVAEASAQLVVPGREAVIEGRVARAERVQGGARIELERVAWVRESAFGPRRMSLSLDDGAPPPPVGATIRVAVRTREFAAGAANPGGGDPLRALARRGVGAAARGVDPALLQIVEPPGANPLTWLANRRLRAIDALLRFGRGGALLAAIGLGDAHGLPERDRRAWAVLGIAHILSVSGLHLVLAAGGAYALSARALARSTRLCARADTRRVALAVALAAAAGYALVSGYAVPALRSLAMLAGAGCAALLRRASSPASALVAAALLVLAFDPAALFAPGAQLSFAATTALVIGRASDAERTGSRLFRALALTLSTTARATLATAPIAALHFGAAPPLAGLANLVAVPLTGVLLMPLALAASALALTAPETALPALLSFAAALAERLLDAALALASFAPRVAPHPPHALALLACVPLLWAALRTRRLWLRVACALLAQAALAFAPPPALMPVSPRIVFLDVGHGDAILVQAREFALLVDAGTRSPDGWDAGARVVVPALAALGVRRLDVLAISHADLDHRGGAPSLLEAFPCAELWLPRGALGDPAFRALVARARELGARVRERGLGDAPLVRESGALRIAPLWPPARAEGLSDNDRSLVLRVEVAGTRALLLGDLEAPGEAALLASGADLRAQIVKLAHHGSRSSSTPALLAAIRPQLAIASAPLRGRFRWPHAEVRERLATSGIALAWTGRDGALLVRLARNEACVRRWRGGACSPLAETRAPPRSSRTNRPPPTPR